MYFGPGFFSHVGTQIGQFLSKHATSDIQFIGKVEHFDKHWDYLLHQPDQFKKCFDKSRLNSTFVDYDSIKTIKDNNGTNIAHVTKHLGMPNKKEIATKRYWQNNNDNKKDYDTILGFGKNSIYYDKPLPPPYYAINKTLFDKIVNHFWQDFLCLNYSHQWQDWKQYVDSFN